MSGVVAHGRQAGSMALDGDESSFKLLPRHLDVAYLHNNYCESNSRLTGRQMNQWIFIDHFVSFYTYIWGERTGDEWT
jgi:hypothetical protein